MNTLNFLDAWNAADKINEENEETEDAATDSSNDTLTEVHADIEPLDKLI